MNLRFFYQRVEGLEQEKEEGQARCVKCYELRLEKTAQRRLSWGALTLLQP